VIALSKPTVRPEDSVPMRVVVALAVELGVLAVVLQGAVDVPAAVAALVLAPVGYLFSYRHRAATSFALKLALSVGLLLALMAFLRSVGQIRTVDEARIPLASLFLWVQVLHAFDVPRRRDLAFSMVSSTTLVAAAGAIALTGSFIWIVLGWAALSAAWLWLSAAPRPDEVTGTVSLRFTREGRRRRAPAVRSAVAAGLTAVLLGSLVFMAMPRLPARLVRTPPFSFGGAQPQPAADGADSTSNPSLPPPDADGVVNFAADAYPGFSGAMDLRARGLLSDEIAFRVRADQPALWRAEILDTYDGSIWTASDPEQVTLDTGWNDALRVPAGDLDETPQVTRIVQTFYLESDQPNVVFGAHRIDEVYFPGGGLQSDRYGAVRSPVLLEDGLVYSVVSEIPVFDPAMLATMGDPPTSGERQLERYLQLPEALPGRVRDLAARITAGAETPYERAISVQDWLQANTLYDLTVAREPAGVDAVDHFLFETQRGFCEHIASAMVVLLRSAGVPARIATGYGPGERNPLTGYFEVRHSDAHAWVEVALPGLGWMTFDPTFGVPPAEPSFASRFLAPEMMAAIGRTVAGIVPASVRSSIGSALASLREVAGSASAALGLILGAVAVAAGVVTLIRRRRRGRDPGPPDDIGRAFEDLLAAAQAAGHAHAPSATPREFLDAFRAHAPLDDETERLSAFIVDAFERERFARDDDRPSDAEVMRALAAAARVRDLVARR
jgi:transglutaminase-like putative cysteine protease